MVADAFKAIREYRHAPSDLLNEAHQKVQVELYKLLKTVPRPEFRLPFPEEDFKTTLDKIVKQGHNLEQAKIIVHEWMTDKIQQSLSKATGPGDILEAHFLFCDEQVRLKYLGSSLKNSEIQNESI